MVQYVMNMCVLVWWMSDVLVSKAVFRFAVTGIFQGKSLRCKLSSVCAFPLASSVAYLNFKSILFNEV